MGAVSIPPPPPARPAPGPRPRTRAVRLRRGRLLGGVCSGLAEHVGWQVTWVRVAFVVLALFGGFGIALYAAYWAWLPLAAADGSVADRAENGRDLAGVLGLAALALGVVLFLAARGADVTTSWIVPLLLGGAGVAVLWRQSDDSRRSELIAGVNASARATTRTALRNSYPRIGLGVALVVLGALGVVASQGDLGASLRGLAAAILALVGIGLVLLPFGLGWWRDLASERRARIRSEERAEVAAQVHDSVLQTLTLIQRAAHDPDEVVRLARTEERALRRWLYTPTADPTSTLVGALEAEVATVEGMFACAVEVVHVGDVPRDDRVDALVAATREAVVNAAKHAGGQVSVYVECGRDEVEVFVRDRGPGFDPDAVADDRLGLRESVVGRMARAGGTATIRSAPGEGAEVALTLPMSLGAKPLLVAPDATAPSAGWPPPAPASALAPPQPAAPTYPAPLEHDPRRSTP
ncbi:PspC domain-containing protein [Longivirga aurantiaca]|uniref:PspC domain-containing protein n=1 Tax=Longivirga aurantiaca TaxID=1837743 RepID=A0ABW1SZ42_9ACTN